MTDDTTIEDIPITNDAVELLQAKAWDSGLPVTTEVLARELGWTFARVNTTMAELETKGLATVKPTPSA